MNGGGLHKHLAGRTSKLDQVERGGEAMGPQT